MRRRARLTASTWVLLSLSLSALPAHATDAASTQMWMKLLLAGAVLVLAGVVYYLALSKAIAPRADRPRGTLDEMLSHQHRERASANEAGP